MDNEQESPPSSPALEGYDTAGEEINVSSGSETTVPSPVRRRKTPKKPTKRLPQRYNQRDSKGRFIKALACCSKPRRETGTGSEGGLDADSESVDSLQWDAHTEDLDVNPSQRVGPVQQWTGRGWPRQRPRPTIQNGGRRQDQGRGGKSSDGDRR